jgi:hypothetical protein
MTVVVPGSINPAFEAVIKETNKRIRGMKMAESFHFHVEQQRKDGKLAAMASKWTKEQLDVPFANVVTEFAVLNDSIVSESSTKSPSFVSWLSSPPTSISRSGSPVSSLPTARTSMVNRTKTRPRRPLNSL